MQRTELTERWLAALRSGEYKQGRRMLAETDGDENRIRYCCLGVLCELTGAFTKDYPSLGWAAPGWAMPPLTVRVRVGAELGEFERLATANDAGVSFNRIADMIEEMIPDDED